MALGPSKPTPPFIVWNFIMKCIRPRRRKLQLVSRCATPLRVDYDCMNQTRRIYSNYYQRDHDLHGCWCHGKQTYAKWHRALRKFHTIIGTIIQEVIDCDWIELIEWEAVWPKRRERNRQNESSLWRKAVSWRRPRHIRVVKRKFRKEIPDYFMLSTYILISTVHVWGKRRLLKSKSNWKMWHVH